MFLCALGQALVPALTMAALSGTKHCNSRLQGKCLSCSLPSLCPSDAAHRGGIEGDLEVITLALDPTVSFCPLFD